MIDYDIIENSGKIVFFLHGWGGDKNSFAVVKNHLACCKMVFVSFSGFGNSEQPNKPYSVLDYALELKDLIVSVAKGKQVVLVCHSFGARVAVKLCSLYPCLVEKLMIIGGAGVKPRRSLNYHLKVYKYKRLKSKVKKGKADPKVLECYGSSDYKKLTGLMKQTFINVVNEDLKDCFKKVRCDTLLFWGENDTETPLYMARKINKWIKNSELIVLEGAGHFCYIDNIPYFIRVLNAFLID